MLLATVTFVVLTTLAMVQYPGGSKYELASHRYQFFDNFFSDLGATRTYAGYSNTTSCVLFIISTTAVGLGLIAFSGTWRAIGARRGVAKPVSRAYQGCAVLSGICFIGIGATPWNLLLSAHNALVRLAFVLLLGCVVAMVVAQVHNRWPWPYVAANVAFMIILAAYVGVLVAGPALDTRGGLGFQVTAQKIMVYSSLLNLFLQGWGIRAALIRAAHPRLKLA